MNRGAWWVTVHGAQVSDTTSQLSQDTSSSSVESQVCFPIAASQISLQHSFIIHLPQLLGVQNILFYRSFLSQTRFKRLRNMASKVWLRAMQQYRKFQNMNLVQCPTLSHLSWGRGRVPPLLLVQCLAPAPCSIIKTRVK